MAGGNGDMVVTFCGHREIEEYEEVKDWLISTAEQLISKGADTFYFGGYGGFDSLSASVLRELQKTYPHIRLVLVLAYLNRDYDLSKYDATLYPQLENVPPRFAILKRNEKMVDLSDVVVAYVTHNWGGAAKTLAYAKRKGKQTLCFSDTPAKALEEFTQM